jgi:hypothetical protein
MDAPMTGAPRRPLVMEPVHDRSLPALQPNSLSAQPLPRLGLVLFPTPAFHDTHLDMRRGYGVDMQSWLENRGPWATSVVLERLVDHRVGPSLDHVRLLATMIGEGAMSHGHEPWCVLAIDLLTDPRELIDHPLMDAFHTWKMPLAIVSLARWRRHGLTMALQQHLWAAARKLDPKLAVELYCHGQV